MEIVIQLLILAAGFVLLVKGADWFVDGAAGIAAKFGIPELVIGLTIVAMGTSAPEAAVSITAALRGSAEITIGNIVGSNIMNVLIILGLSAMITPLAVAHSTVRYEIPFVIFVTGVFYLQGMDGAISRMNGVILWGLFLIYLTYLFILAKQDMEDGEEEQRSVSLPRALLGTGIGLVLIILGSDLTVDAASALARVFGMSERFIGLTIVALGTSLPELFTSVTAAMKKNADIAIGNIVGSNLFNILFVVGTSSLIIDIPFAANFRMDLLVAIGAVLLLWVCCLRGRVLRRWAGVLMVGCYAAYFFLGCL